MTWPTPRVGHVIRYAYLWKTEADAGLEEGLKDRPAVIVLAYVRESEGLRVVVAPITHSPPLDLNAALEVPPKTRNRLGLDGDRQWIILDDLNSFLWPGPDLRPLPGQGLQSVIVGELPAALTTMVKTRLQERITAHRVAVTTRSE